jgi:hypothetical protein
MRVVRWHLVTLAAIPLLLSLLGPARSSPALEWWTTHSLDKIRPFDRQPNDANRAVKIYAAGNEFEPFQIVLRTDGHDLEGIDVEVTDLQGRGGVIPSNRNVSVYLERYVNISIPSSITGGTGEWPDALIPRVDRYKNEKRNAFPFKLVSGRSQAVWIDVYVPPATTAGLYRGQVRVLTMGKAQLSIPIELEVWNFKLPSTSSLVTTFGFSGNTAIRAHLGKYTNDADVFALTYQYQKSALWHRITLDGGAGVTPSLSITDNKVQVRWDAYDSVVAPFMDGIVFSPGDPLYGAKATSVALRTSHALKTPEQRIQFWRQAAEHFRRKGWFGRLFHYLWDEPRAEHYQAMIQLGRDVRRADPEIKNLVTAPLHPEWSEFIDIWTPVINCFERKPRQSDYCDPTVEFTQYASERAQGKQLWWYQACGSHGCYIVGGEYFRGWPSYMIDHAPVLNRIMEWMTWKYGIQGELYFSTNEAFAKTNPWKDIRLYGGNGDGTLFYPGRPDTIGGTTHIPVESIRLKLIREGLEDYEYLVMLAKRSGRKNVATSVDKIIRKTFDFNQDPLELYGVREKIGREIARTRP